MIGREEGKEPELGGDQEGMFIKTGQVSRIVDPRSKAKKRVFQERGNNLMLLDRSSKKKSLEGVVRGCLLDLKT